MPGKHYVRLRQICMAAPELKPAEAALSDILGLNAFHRSPGVAPFGLENIVMPLNGSFLEIVAPIKADTNVDRFLKRYGGRGGYMAIFDTDNVARHRAAAEAGGIRVVHADNRDTVQIVQYHPADVGAAIVEIDHHIGGDDRFGHFEFGGKGWQKAVNTDIAVDLLGIEIESTQGAERAEVWSRLLMRPVATGADGSRRIELDHAFIDFRPADHGELFTAAVIAVRDVASVIERARRHGCASTNSSFHFCGLDFRLEQV